jgi:dipeptidyl aminopeptidase/acylaminoacyl peptidase
VLTQHNVSPTLEQLLRIGSALPADLRDDGTALVRWNVPGSFQLYTVPPGGEPLQLTDLGEPVTGLFVPGSDRILLAVDQGGNERAQLYLLDVAPGATPEPLVVEPELLHETPTFSADGKLLAYACNRRNGRDLDVFVRSLETGGERCVFSPGGYSEVAGFSPDGRWLGVLRLTDRTGDNDLHLVDLVDGGDILVAPDEHDALFGPPAWSRESSAFLFATSSGRDTAGIARYELATGDWSYVLEDAWDLECVGDQAGSVVGVHTNEEGYSRLALYDPDTMALRRRVELPDRGVIETLVLSPDGRRLAFGFSSPRTTWDAWLLDTETGEPRRLTASPTAVPDSELVAPTLHRYASFDGESIPYLVYRPAPDGAAPILLEIHGGPEAQRRPMWIPLVQYLVGSGLAVVQPNVRGSTGYGKRFEHLDDGRRRLDTVRDVAALHDELKADRRFAADRTVLYGGSYGGYMVLACLAFEPERWAGAVAVVPISSLVTFLRNTSEYRRAFREREYGSLERDLEFLVEVSPITHVDRIRAPLLLIHGANDPRVPLGEAEQIHQALRERGIRSELLVYHDEGHGLQKLPNRLDAYPRAVSFIEEILGLRIGTK